MKLNKYQMTAAGIIGVLSHFLISKAGLQIYVSLPLALVLALAIFAISDKLAARVKDETSESDSA